MDFSSLGGIFWAFLFSVLCLETRHDRSNGKVGIWMICLRRDLLQGRSLTRMKRPNACANSNDRSSEEHVTGNDSQQV